MDSNQAGIKKLEGLNLPALTLLDVSFNGITEVDSLANMLRLCRNVQQLNLADNPICDSYDFENGLPPYKSKVWKALQLAPALEVIIGSRHVLRGLHIQYQVL